MYVIAGSPYKLSLLVRNRGNALALVRVKAASPGGELASVDPGFVTLQPGESRPVAVQVDPPKDEASQTDAVVEVTATDSEDPGVPVSAFSAHDNGSAAPGVTEPFATVPAQLRSASRQNRQRRRRPIELIGGGRLREGGAEQIDFTFRGSPGRVSPFGEREEYRLDLRAPHYRARLGDNFFALSPLTSEGQAGFGGGLELTPGRFGLRGYSQRFRFEPGTPHETGFSASFDPGSLFYGSRFALNAVQRSGGNLAGGILGSSASLHPLPDMLVETEYASNVGSGRKGSAHSLRVSGNGWLRYDAAHVGGSGTFAGPTRGATDDYATLTRSVSEKLDLNLTGNSHRSGYLSDSVTSRQWSRSGTMGATWSQRIALEFSGFSRQSEFAGSPHRRKGGACSHTRRAAVCRRKFLGERRRWEIQRRHGFAHALVHTAFGWRERESRAQHVFWIRGILQWSLSVARTSWLDDTRRQRQRESHRLACAMGYRIRNPLCRRRYRRILAIRWAAHPKSSARPHHKRQNATFQSRWADAATGQNRYLEYGMPLRVPVGRLRSPGTVTGSVLDAESGSAVSGALVRLGPAAALSDADGRVSFRGLPGASIVLRWPSPEARRTPSSLATPES